jgi:hypothetical protein
MAAAAAKPLFDKRKMALAKARFRAWWEGEHFDEDAALAAIEADHVAANENIDQGALEDELFEFDMPPRLAALQVLWGEGRIRPGEESADGLQIARLGLEADGVLALFGPGLLAPLAAIAAKHPGRIEIYEWREETIAALRHQVKEAKLNDRVTVTLIDLESHALSPAAFDGLFSTDDFAYASYQPHLAQQVMKGLKPGACAVIEAYVGFKAAEFATAFASCFAEPQIRPHGDLLKVLTDTGLIVEGDEDITDEFLALARTSFLGLGQKLADATKLSVAAARELAWEAEAWKTRLRLLAQLRLQRRRIVVRKPAEEALPAPAVEEAVAEAPPAEVSVPVAKEPEPDTTKHLEIMQKVLAESEKNKR